MSSEDKKQALSKEEIAIICITKNGLRLATEIQDKLGEGNIFFVKSQLDDKLQELLNSSKATSVKAKLKEFVPQIFNEYRYIVFIMATGIVVRTIAPLIQSKFEDPAVIVTDERGTNVISLLSGHMGGANEMTLYISHLIDSNPVITTATDVNNKSSLDMIAKKLDGYIENFRDSVVKANSMIVNNKKIGLYIDGNYEVDTRGFELLQKEDIDAIDDIETIVVISDKQDLGFKNQNIIKLVPRDIVLGIGCKRDTDCEHMKTSLLDFLQKHNIDIHAVKAIGSIEVKKDEKAIIEIGKYLNVPFKVFTVEELSTVDELYEKSDWVKKNVGVHSVSDPSAHLLSGGNVIVNKTKYQGITFSIGRVE